MLDYMEIVYGKENDNRYEARAEGSSCGIVGVKYNRIEIKDKNSKAKARKIFVLLHLHIIYCFSNT